MVVSNLNPRLLYTQLVDAGALPADFLRRMQAWRCGSGTFRMNVALSELPDFSCLPGREAAEHHASGIIIAPSLQYMEKAYHDARALGWAREPIVEVLIPSTLDASLANVNRALANMAQATANAGPVIERIGRGAEAIEKMGNETALASASAGKTIDSVGVDVKRFTADALPELERLLGEGGLAEDLRRRGLARAARFSWRAAAERLLSLLPTAPTESAR